MRKKKTIPRGAPAKIWIIMDPLDGIHVFTSHHKAEKMLKKWQDEAEYDPCDSVWDMKGPYEYDFLV